jgi:hypothetical protein
MDLGTIKSNLENNLYTSSRLWARDIQLVWDNAKSFNPRKTLIHEAAEKLSQKCSRVLKSIPKSEPDLWALKVTKINQKMKALLRDPPPTNSIFPRKPELILKF